MDRGTHQPLSVAEAKERLRSLTSGEGAPRPAGVTLEAARAAARGRPWVALAAAAALGLVAGASPRARATLWRIVERTLL